MNKSKTMTMGELRQMNDEDLKRISLERNSKGKFSQSAENAMKVRRERAGVQQWRGISRNAPSFIAEVIAEKGSSHFTKKFK